MRNIKISTRLFLGFSLLMVLLLAMSSIGAWRILDAEKDSKAIQHSDLINTTIMHWVRNVHLNGERAQAVPNMTDSQAVETFQKRMRETSAQIDQYQNQVDQLLVLPEARTLFDNVLAARRAYTGPRAIALQDLNNGNEEKALNFFRNQMPGLIANYIGAIEQVYKFQLAQQEALYAEIDRENSFGLWMLGIATVVSLILGPLFSYLISRSIIVPLDNAVQLSATVAKQDLTVNITPQGNDEITMLQQALRDMVDNLRNAVADVYTGAETIALASREISDGNIDLSARTDQQASSLAETAASMEEITATVRQSADNAQQANSLSVEASATAQDGGRMVDGLVQTMAEINTKAQQISDIVGMIDSIAFQTNILALNAAVEAARAGEQGRGFAVVASEVRALAQRSAASARDIAKIINESVIVITNGNEQAALTGERMQDLVVDITKVTDIVAEIDSATKEQSIGIEQINTAITQMDDVTRQNASLVQQSSAAAASLQEQADALATLVSTFKTDRRKSNEQLQNFGRRKLDVASSEVININDSRSNVKLLS